MRRPFAGDDATAGYAAVLVATVFWGLGPLFVRGISASGPVIASYRNWIAVPVALVIAKVAGTPLTRSVLRGAIPAGLFFVTSQGIAFIAFGETSIANATLIQSLAPILVVVVAVRMFGEHLSRVQIAWMAFAVFGVFLVVVGASSGSGATLRGDALAAVSLELHCGYLLTLKRGRVDGHPAAAFTAAVFVIGAVVGTPFAVLASSSGGTISGEDWLWLVLLALVTGCGGHGLMTWAQGHVDIGIASIITLGTVVVSTFGAWLVFDQALTLVQLGGAAALLAGLVGVLSVQLRQQGPAGLPDLTEPPVPD